LLRLQVAWGRSVALDLRTRSSAVGEHHRSSASELDATQTQDRARPRRCRKTTLL
jgi:hypothetical protein